MALLFAKQPGCRESHLKRQYHNALLATDNSITQQDVNQAHQLDLDELEQFKTEFARLMNEAAALDANAESDIILKLKEDLDKLYEQCAGLAGDTTPYKNGIAKLTRIVMNAVKTGAGNDPTAVSELEQEDAARNMHYQLLEYPLVSHLLRPDSPVQANELAAVLLGEETECVSAILALFDDEQIMDLAKQAEALLTEHSGNIPGAPYAEDILKLIQDFPGQGACH